MRAKCQKASFDSFHVLNDRWQVSKALVTFVLSSSFVVFVANQEIEALVGDKSLIVAPDVLLQSCSPLHRLHLFDSFTVLLPDGVLFHFLSFGILSYLVLEI